MFHGEDWASSLEGILPDDLMEGDVRYRIKYSDHRLRSFALWRSACLLADIAASCACVSSWGLDEVETSSACSIRLAS
jgi:hypothetical protein